MKYLVEFKLNENAVGTPDAEEFEPYLICRLHELYEVLEMECDPRFDNIPKLQEIVSIRPATPEEEEKYAHYYC